MLVLAGVCFFFHLNESAYTDSLYYVRTTEETHLFDAIQLNRLASTYRISTVYSIEM